MVQMSLPRNLWLAPPGSPALKNGDVHVWRVRLDQPPPIRETLSTLLDPDEKQRATSFCFPKDREHFSVARGALREVLSRYLHISAKRIQFTPNEYGKPSVSGQTSENRLRFNLSHSHGVALYALTGCGAIGVDIELIREEVAGLLIAKGCFSPIELSKLRALPRDLQTTAFFRCWTRKEAYIKARGEGLSHPLDQFVVSLAPGEPASLLHTANDPTEASEWSLRDVDPYPNYVAAIAVRSQAPTLHHWKLFDED